MHKLFLDWESYYTTDYTLKKLSLVEYIRSPKFKAHGLSYAFEDDPVKWVTSSDAETLFSRIDWNKTALVAHNAKFDAFILSEHFGCTPAQYICTQAMSRAVLGRTIKSHSLAYLAEHFGLQSKGTMKTLGIRDLSPEQESELAEYGCHDTWLCREIFNRLSKDFPENQYPILDWTIRTFCNPKYVLDVASLRSAAAKEIREKRKRFRSLGIEAGIFRSNQKFPELLIAKGYTVPLKDSPKQKNEDGMPKKIPAIALGDTAFVEMLESPDEQLRTLCEARKAAKSNIIETRSKTWAKAGATGRWPFDVQFSGAEQTHRFSGGSGGGGNPQNAVKDSVLRSAVGVPEGFALVVGDTSQIEARFVAYLANDPELRRVIETQPDLYCDYGSRLYKRPITKADKLERAFSKEAILGLGYNMGWEKFTARVKIKLGKELTEEEARAAVAVYRTAYKNVPALWQRLNDWIAHLADGSSGEQFANIKCLRWDKERLYLPSGLPLQYRNLRAEENGKDRWGKPRHEWVYDIYDKGKLIKRKLYGGKLLENICQSLAGEFIKEVLEHFLEVATGQVHDELHMIVLKSLADMYRKRLEIAMTTPPKWFPELHLAAEVHVGTTWGNSK